MKKSRKREHDPNYGKDFKSDTLRRNIVTPGGKVLSPRFSVLLG